MWPFTARVNEKTAPIERIAAVAICRRRRGIEYRSYLLQCECPLLALSGRTRGVARCSLLGAKRTKANQGVMSAPDPKRTKKGSKYRGAAVSYPHPMACYPRSDGVVLNPIQNISVLAQGPSGFSSAG
jgi:hypothetical protein